MATSKAIVVLMLFLIMCIKGKKDDIHCHESAAEWVKLKPFGAPTTTGKCNSLAFMANVDQKVKECVPTNAWYECNGFIEKFKEKGSCSSDLEVECWIGTAAQNSITGGTITTPCREIDMNPSNKKLICESTEVIAALHIADKKAKCCPLVGYAPTTTPTPPTTAEPTIAEPTTAEPTTSEPTTAEPTTAEPTTAEPTTAETTTTAEPTTAEPPTAKPTTLEPTTAEQTTLAATAEPTTVDPTTAEPTTAEPTTAELTTAEQSTAELTTVVPTTAELTSAAPTTFEATVSPPTVTPGPPQPTAAVTPQPTANESIPLHQFKLQVAFEMLIEAVPIPALEATMARTLQLRSDESVKVLSVTPASVLVVFVVITRTPVQVVKRTTEEAVRNPSHPLSKDFLAIDGSVALTAEPPKRLPLSGYMLFGFVAVFVLSASIVLGIYIHRRRTGALDEELAKVVPATTAVKCGRLLIDGRCFSGECPPEEDSESATELATTARTVTWSATTTTDSRHPRSGAASRANGYQKKSPVCVRSTSLTLTDSDEEEDRAFVRPCEDGRDGQVAEFLGVDEIVQELYPSAQH